MNVYDVPFVRPVTAAVVGAGFPVTSTGAAPPEGVTTYLVTVAPPSLVGAVHVTVACALPGVAVTFVGASGATGSVSGALASLPSPFVVTS